MQTQPSFHFITFLLLFSNELQFFQKKSSKVLHFLWNIRSKTLHYLVVATGIFNVLSNSVSCSLAHYDIIAFQCLLPLNNPVSILFPGLRYADCKCTIVPFTISVKQLTNDYVKKKKKKRLCICTFPCSVNTPSLTAIELERLISHQKQDLDEIE